MCPQNLLNLFVIFYFMNSVINIVSSKCRLINYCLTPVNTLRKSFCTEASTKLLIATCKRALRDKYRNYAPKWDTMATVFILQLRYQNDTFFY